MRDIQFIKMQGTGNDFIIIDGIKNPDIVEAGRDLSLLARQLCDRNFGIGADGLILVLPSEKADYRMRIINPDGSEAEMCGNGIRCFTRFVWEKAQEKKDVISVETLAGIMVPAPIVDGDSFVGVEVDMGEPVVEAVKEPLKIENLDYFINKISMGNPHCVIFVEDLQSVRIKEIGQIIENLPQFPNRTNVEFVQVINDKEIMLKVWERGAGETLACGTGACASVVAASLNNLTGKKVVVHLPGGDLGIEWAPDDHVIMRGPAEKVFEGTIRI
ncbi:MAG: diaminopimelate epimerase [Candidatus Margulisiibacteriota bacterium]